MNIIALDFFLWLEVKSINEKFFSLYGFSLLYFLVCPIHGEPRHKAIHPSSLKKLILVFSGNRLIHHSEV